MNLSVIILHSRMMLLTGLECVVAQEGFLNQRCSFFMPFALPERNAQLPTVLAEV
jgi:hypothetical protein